METVTGFEIGIAFVNFPFRAPKQPINVKSSTVQHHNRNSDAFSARSDSADTIALPQDSNVATEIRRNNNVKFRPSNKTTRSGNRKAILRERRKNFHCGDRHYKRERVFFFGAGVNQSPENFEREPGFIIRHLRSGVYEESFMADDNVPIFLLRWEVVEVLLPLGNWTGTLCKKLTLICAVFNIIRGCIDI